MFARVLKLYFIGNVTVVWLCSDTGWKQISMLLLVRGKKKEKTKPLHRKSL